MKRTITDNLHHPESLEKLYRENKREFAREFPEVTENNDSELIRFWKIRLSYEAGMVKKFIAQDLYVLMIISLVTAILVKLPKIFTGIDPSEFYIRDLSIVAFNGLIVYFFYQNRIHKKWIMIYTAVLAMLVLYVNFLPHRESDSLTIAFLHVPLFLWCWLGMAYISFDFGDVGKRTGFIRFNGELITMPGLLILAGGILTAITIGLFSAIGVDIEENYMEYIAIPGGIVSPIVASYLIRVYPDITGKIVPVIARVFTPIALVTLVIYLVSLAFSGIRILEDRDILLLFNVLLVAVMAIIIFSITELDKTRNKNIYVLILIVLAGVTLLINSVALIAIAGRLANGFTPNRTAVFITNMLVFINLILLTRDLYRSYLNSARLENVEGTMAKYLLVYFIWTIVAIFILPVIFGFN